MFMQSIYCSRLDKNRPRSIADLLAALTRLLTVLHVNLLFLPIAKSSDICIIHVSTLGGLFYGYWFYNAKRLGELYPVC